MYIIMCVVCVGMNYGFIGQNCLVFDNLYKHSYITNLIGHST